LGPWAPGIAVAAECRWLVTPLGREREKEGKRRGSEGRGKEGSGGASLPQIFWPGTALDRVSETAELEDWVAHRRQRRRRCRGCHPQYLTAATPNILTSVLFFPLQRNF